MKPNTVSAQMERDPRVDPRPGDVLALGTITRTVEDADEKAVRFVACHRGTSSSPVAVTPKEWHQLWHCERQAMNAHVQIIKRGDQP